MKINRLILPRRLNKNKKHMKSTKTKSLLSSSNSKLEKGEKLGWLTLGLSLAPANLSGRNLCPHASKGCTKACLFTSGHGRFDGVKNARLERSHFFLSRRAEFLAQLIAEIRKGEKAAAKKGMKLAVRLNVMSDLPWHNLINMADFPNVQFYDYTPNIKRALQWAAGELPANYHVTFSRKEDNADAVQLAVEAGVNVATVFDAVPESYSGRPVVDGDVSDLRFLDQRGVIVGLKAKGDGKKDTSGFVIRTTVNV
jgi:hypothetical protein